MASDGDENAVGVRIITAAPEVEGVKRGLEEAVKRGVVFSIGHRYDGFRLYPRSLIDRSWLQHRFHRCCHRSCGVRRQTDHPFVQRYAPTASP